MLKMILSYNNYVLNIEIVTKFQVFTCLKWS